MKNLFPCFLMSLLMFCGIALQAQSVVVESTTIANEILMQLDKKKNKKIKAIAVADFTYNGQENTRIGKYLADEVSYKLTQLAEKQDIISREKVRKEYAERKGQKKKSVNTDRIATGGADVLTNEATETKQEKTEDLFKTGSLLAKSVFKGKKFLKDAHAIVTGSIEDKGDFLVLLIEVKRNNSSETVAANSRGKFIKTPELTDMLYEQLPEVETVASTGGDELTTKGGFDEGFGKTFKHENFQYELVSCTQTGKEVQFVLNIVSLEKDATVWMYFDQTKFTDANSGYEYKVNEIKLADKYSSNYRINKYLIADHPIQAVLTFKQVNKEISSISKMWIQAHGHWPAFENIIVN